jgi:hypothetical protein
MEDTSTILRTPHQVLHKEKKELKEFLLDVGGAFLFPQCAMQLGLTGI